MRSIRDRSRLFSFTGRTREEELAWWERMRARGLKWIVLRGAAIGAGLAFLLIALELMVDLLDWSFESPMHYLGPILLVGALGAAVAAGLFASRTIWYRWETTGNKPAYQERYEEYRRANEQRILEEGPVRHVVLAALTGGLAMALLANGSLNPPGIGGTPREFLLSFLGGAVVSGIAAAVVVAGIRDRNRRDS